MCGIVGAVLRRHAWKVDRDKAMDFIEQGTVCGIYRGQDSTGVIRLSYAPASDKKSPGGYIETLKDVMDGTEFVKHTTFQQMLADGEDCRAMLVHHRAATRGSITKENAHPFSEGKITLIKNGTLHNWSTFEIPEGEKKDWAVDSQWFTMMLNHYSIDQLMQQVNGGIAACWHDRRDNTVNFVRNAGRPLHFTYHKHDGILYFASEFGMLSWLQQRNKISGGQHFLLSDDVHMSIDYEGNLKVRDLSIVNDPIPIKKSTTQNSYVNRANSSNHYARRQGTLTDAGRAFNHNYSPNEAVDKLSLTRGEVVRRWNFIAGQKHTCYPMSYVEYGRRPGWGMGVFMHSVNPDIIVAVLNMSKKWWEENVDDTDLQQRFILTSVSLSRAGDQYKDLELKSVNDWYIIANEKSIAPFELQVVDEVFPGDNDTDDTEDEETCYEYVDPEGNGLTEKEAEKCIEAGCNFCTDPLDLEDWDDFSWTKSMRPVCLNCMIQASINPTDAYHSALIDRVAYPAQKVLSS